MVSVWIAVLCGVDFHSDFGNGYDYCYFLGKSPEKVGEVFRMYVFDFRAGLWLKKGGLGCFLCF
jgi:hypothetical protein